MHSYINSDISIDKIANDLYLVSNPNTGALSALSPSEMVIFFLFIYSNTPREKIRSFLEQLGYSSNQVHDIINKFWRRLQKEGWLRSQIPQNKTKFLRVAYFTITRNCNLACSYCYQGLKDRINTDVTLDNVDIILKKVKEVNPNCKIIITGGEPFIHKHVFNIIEQIQEMDLEFSILTNGTLIDQNVAKRLKQYSNLKNIQISIDGITEETNSITRGKGSFEKIIRGIHNVIDCQLPFTLAPTIHEGNLHEIYGLVYFAISNGGFISPNNLRIFPHNSDCQLELSNMSLYNIIKDVEKRVIKDFGIEMIKKYKSMLVSKEDQDSISNRSKFICGMAHSLVNINYNGDVYPCHLLSIDTFKLGNVLYESFETIFQRVDRLGIRVPSFKIPKCSKCPFVATCGGGCRAAAYFTYGSVSREDSLCDIIYKIQMDSVKTGYL